ncbi:hypothetical protein [Metabacillus iocasae]|uniref:DUF4190 domain-containing protein n=1 Tax=Priestia iocasae TaxID=2291674 RepID=A0ABS2QRL8_9BACI|nr:hypothetical protein [Metabacillus iocasae]MBM7702089.1 hypothetical protein [Metabacillus iocasae]
MTSNVLKWVAGGLEALWGLPIIGGTLVVSLLWTPLLFMLALHIVGLVFAIRAGKKPNGHVVGIIASCLGWIPVVGMIMHILTAIFLMVEAGKNE